MKSIPIEKIIAFCGSADKGNLYLVKQFAESLLKEESLGDPIVMSDWFCAKCGIYAMDEQQREEYNIVLERGKNLAKRIDEVRRDIAGLGDMSSDIRRINKFISSIEPISELKEDTTVNNEIKLPPNIHGQEFNCSAYDNGRTDTICDGQCNTCKEFDREELARLQSVSSSEVMKELADITEADKLALCNILGTSDCKLFLQSINLRFMYSVDVKKCFKAYEFLKSKNYKLPTI